MARVVRSVNLAQFNSVPESNSVLVHAVPHLLIGFRLGVKFVCRQHLSLRPAGSILRTRSFIA